LGDKEAELIRFRKQSSAISVPPCFKGFVFWRYLAMVAILAIGSKGVIWIS
jgi:hypothetical protein